MQNWFVLALCLLTTPAPAAEGWRIVDGDTVWSPSGEKIRILGIDAPELHPCRCKAECELGQKALSFVRIRVESARVVEVARTGQDRYGRTLARLRVDGSDPGSALVAKGLARVWRGKREPWC
jgi:micrococcal nuclease